MEIYERHRHRYEFNPEYEKPLAEAGLFISGKNPDYGLVELVELKGHPWFLGCQFHPEFKSRPLKPHPLFKAFIGASHARRRERRKD
jgi:CTP synthase